MPFRWKHLSPGPHCESVSHSPMQASRFVLKPALLPPEIGTSGRTCSLRVTVANVMSPFHLHVLCVARLQQMNGRFLLYV